MLFFISPVSSLVQNFSDVSPNLRLIRKAQLYWDIVRHLHMTKREVRRNCRVLLRKSCSARPDLFDFPTAFFTGQTSSVVLT